MALPILSFTNLVAAATVTPSTEDANYPGANIKTPERPFLPWRTTTTGSQNIVIDLGSALTWDFIAVLHANYTSANLQANASDSWGAPTMNVAATFARNPLTHRYQHLEQSTRTLRYIRLLINSQTPTDGASYYRTGGIFVGTITNPPRAPRWGATYRMREPVQEEEGLHGGLQLLELGDELAELDLEWTMRVTPTTPFSGDQADTWQDLERQIKAASRRFLYAPNLGDKSQVWVMRRRSSLDYTLQVGQAVKRWRLQEAVGP